MTPEIKVYAKQVKATAVALRNYLTTVQSLVKQILIEESNVQPVNSPVTVYGFYDECQRKYGNANAWRYCTDVFDYLTLSAIIDGTVLCVHGGLSPDIRPVDQIRVIERNCEIPHEGPFCDLMWSDPEDIETWAVSPRGAGWLFGSRVTSEFNHINNLDLVCRAHQLVQEGLKYMFQDKGLVTVILSCEMWPVEA
ncbi:unnamed protein product [Lupinus luteus]|uniref:protein-serine/threonine phosphatase n=1 Tax=Lupinus luteus TaxID=3873 RepID=A0AAV1WGD2_LUPLU